MFVFNPGSENNFIGRESEVDFIISQFRQGQNIYLTGPRRFGKTSLIKHIISVLQKRNFFTVYVNFFTITSINQLAAEIIESVLENSGLKEVFREYRCNPQILNSHPKLKKVVAEYDFLNEFTKKSTDNYNLLAKCVDFIELYSIRMKKRIACFWDEFGDYRKLDDGRLTKLLKSKFNQHRNTSYLFSGSYISVMNALFKGYNAPFSRKVKKVSLHEIEPKVFIQLYKKRFKDYNIEPSSEYLTRVLSFTGGHPYYSQLLLQEIIVYHLINSHIPDFDELIEQTAYAEKDYLEKTWEEIAGSKQNGKTVLAIARNPGKVYTLLRNSNVNIYRSLKTLAGYGLLFVNSDKTYRMSDPLLNFWIKRNVQKLDMKSNNSGA